MRLQEKADRLFEDQKKEWPLLGHNWAQLKSTRLRTFSFEGFEIRIQFNPERIRSSAAKVDKGSIEKRPCFLCRENQPPEEGHVDFGEDYEILCNPFPIFDRHFTIGKLDHTPQVIEPEFGRMLDLSRNLPQLVVFYNAPNCGASAPDHMHFQAGNLGFLPIEDELEGLKTRFGHPVLQKGELEIHAVDDSLRRFLLLESDRKDRLEACIGPISEFMRGHSEQEEAMLNILCYYDGLWKVLVFPRALHRPWQFFEEGEQNILLSPASVDMGGCMITPLEKDFLKISQEDIRDIFEQVMYSAAEFESLLVHIRQGLE